MNLNFSTREARKKNAQKLAVGSVIAAAAGYVAGVLTAPKSGKETRADIKQAAENTYATAERELKKLHTELGELLTEAKDRAGAVKGEAKKDLDKAAEVAKTVEEKTREVLSAIHEGCADDKELQKAIDEATKAVTHLRNYLKKV